MSSDQDISSSSPSLPPAIPPANIPPAAPLPPSFPAAAAAAIPLADPRATPDYQVAWELEAWRRSEYKLQLDRWKAEESDRLRVLEEEMSLVAKSEEAKIQARLVRVVQQEKTVGEKMNEVEKIRAALRLAQGELAARVASLDREISRHKSDSDMASKRAREQAAYEVGKAQATLRDQAQEMESLRRRLRMTEARLNELREETEKERARHAKSTVGIVEGKLNRALEENQNLREKLAAMQQERDREREKTAAATDKGVALLQEIERLKSAELEMKHRDAEALRLQALQRERQAGARRNVQDMHEIGRQVKAHLQAMVGGGSSNTSSSFLPPPPQPTFLERKVPENFHYHVFPQTGKE